MRVDNVIFSFPRYLKRLKLYIKKPKMLSYGVETNVPYHLGTFNMQLSNSMQVLPQSSQTLFNNGAETRKKETK